MTTIRCQSDTLMRRCLIDVDLRVFVIWVTTFDSIDVESLLFWQLPVHLVIIKQDTDIFISLYATVVNHTHYKRHILKQFWLRIISYSCIFSRNYCVSVSYGVSVWSPLGPDVSKLFVPQDNLHSLYLGDHFAVNTALKFVKFCDKKQVQQIKIALIGSNIVSPLARDSLDTKLSVAEGLIYPKRKFKYNLQNFYSDVEDNRLSAAREFFIQVAEFKCKS